jgi:hypothetical protein
MFVRCLAREPDTEERARLSEALGAFRDRYEAAPEDAARLVKVGEAPLPETYDPSELASWMMIANAMLNLSETITQH